MTFTDEKPILRTVDRALSVLDCFTVGAGRWRMTALAQRSGLPVPTVHRILSVLESFGYVARDPDSREYRLGPSAACLDRPTNSVPAAFAPALPVLDSLRSATRESVLLAAPAGECGRQLEFVEAGPGDEGAFPRPRGFVERTGPLHAGAPFKIILAYMPSERIEGLIERGLDRWGPATIINPALLRAELTAIRRRGWAVSREETTPGQWAVAVPVLDENKAPNYAIGLAAPLARLEPSRAHNYLSALKSARRALSHKLPDPTADRFAEVAQV